MTLVLWAKCDLRRPDPFPNIQWPFPRGRGEQDMVLPPGWLGDLGQVSSLLLFTKEDTRRNSPKGSNVACGPGAPSKGCCQCCGSCQGHINRMRFKWSRRVEPVYAAPLTSRLEASNSHPSNSLRIDCSPGKGSLSRFQGCRKPAWGRSHQSFLKLR